MKIEADKNAIDYIKKNGGTVNVDLFTSNSCCVQITEPIVNFGIPQYLDQFDEYDIEGIKVYVSRFIHLKEDVLKISLKSFMGIKNLSLSGVRLL